MICGFFFFLVTPSTIVLKLRSQGIFWLVESALVNSPNVLNLTSTRKMFLESSPGVEILTTCLDCFLTFYASPFPRPAQFIDKGSHAHGSPFLRVSYYLARRTFHRSKLAPFPSPLSWTRRGNNFDPGRIYSSLSRQLCYCSASQIPALGREREGRNRREGEKPDQRRERGFDFKRREDSIAMKTSSKMGHIEGTYRRGGKKTEDMKA